MQKIYWGWTLWDGATLKGINRLCMMSILCDKGHIANEDKFELKMIRIMEFLIYKFELFFQQANITIKQKKKIKTNSHGIQRNETEEEISVLTWRSVKS